MVTIDKDMTLIARDLFIDRICDDLSEVILQYLPIEDKFRFECVSKQFQRTIFQRHYTLVLGKYVWNSVKRSLSPKKFEILLKKLPNIRRLEHKPHEECNHLILEDRNIKLLMKYCNNLVEIFDCDFFVNTIRKSFVEKFGSKFVTITANMENLKLIGNSFPNIRELNDVSHLWSNRVNLPFEQFFGMKFKFLKKLSLYLPEKQFNSQLTNNWKIFIENHKSLTHLSLRLRLREDYLIDAIISQISVLNQLVSLKMEGHMKKDFLIKFLKQVSKSCPKLKTLYLSFITYDQGLEDLSFINEIKKFKQLKRLGIEFQRLFLYSFQMNEQNWNNSFKSGFENLTHLKIIIHLDGFKIIDPILIKDFDKYFPNLRELVIRDAIKLGPESADIFSGLLKLETLDIEWYNQMPVCIQNLIQTKLTTNCKRIKTISVQNIGDSDDDIQDRKCSLF